MQWLLDHVSFDSEECLTWPFTRISGYAGTVLVEGRHQRACRVMCALAHGPAPTPGLETAHSCGKGDEACINPKHLRWATHTENGADRKLHALQRKALQPESAKQPGETIADDLLIGADRIADYLHGDPEERRQIYGMKPEDRKALGIFKWGKQYAALKTTLRQNIAALAEPERVEIAAKAAKKGGR
jgi:hypothetical protein